MCQFGNIELFNVELRNTNAIFIFNEKKIILMKRIIIINQVGQEIKNETFWQKIRRIALQSFFVISAIALFLGLLYVALVVSFFLIAALIVAIIGIALYQKFLGKKIKL